MPIQIGGKVDVNAPREQVWSMIFDLDTMRGVIGRIPGITLERLEQIDDMTYEATAVVGVAAIKGKYDGKITVLEKTPPSYVRVKGEGKGGGNWTSGEVSLNLNEVDGHTEMAYKGQGNLNGPLASLGQRLVDSVGRQFIDQGAKIFAGEIEQRVAMTPGEEMHVEATPAYGFGFQALVTLIVVGSIAVLIAVLITQSWPR
ncbi:MAG TPA: carbon monoxide dehydrogenase subunit G [Anaerolineae bacterium]|nr:carbon monoxide dehydrogenase subunit G [Anaerolineae bacterium]